MRKSKFLRLFRGHLLDEQIRDAIRTAIHEQARSGGKILHVGEQRIAAIKILDDRGIRPEVGGLQKPVKHILKEPEFASARRKQGQRITKTSRTPKR
jgi:hypothetical protein